MTSLAIHMLQGDALRMEQFFKHASCHPTTQFEDFNHVNADATDETKIVTTKFVLGFCHGQLRFCLLVRIGPYRAGNLDNFLLYVSLICLIFFKFFIATPTSSPYELVFSLTCRLHSSEFQFARSLDRLALMSEESLPEDIINSNGGASLTICKQASFRIVHEVGLRCIKRSFSFLLLGLLHQGGNVVLALDSKEL